MDGALQLGWAGRADYGDLSAIMYDAVHNGPSRYSRAQRIAWVPAPPSAPEWEERLARQEIVIARRSCGTAVGFMSLDKGGYIDFVFIRPDAQGSGLFRRMYEWIERRAVESGETRLWVHASLMAQPAFASVGFQVVKHEVVQVGSERFNRAEMAKALASPGE